MAVLEPDFRATDYNPVLQTEEIPFNSNIIFLKLTTLDYSPQ